MVLPIGVYDLHMTRAEGQSPSLPGRSLDPDGLHHERLVRVVSPRRQAARHVERQIRDVSVDLDVGAAEHDASFGGDKKCIVKHGQSDKKCHLKRAKSDKKCKPWKGETWLLCLLEVSWALGARCGSRGLRWWLGLSCELQVEICNVF